MTRETWFQPGTRYKVLKNINADLKYTRGQPFVPGQVVVFQAAHFSRYDGATGYAFVVEGIEKKDAWFDHYDVEPEPNWSEYFEPLS